MESTKNRQEKSNGTNMKNQIKMLISGSIATIFTSISLGSLIMYFTYDSLFRITYNYLGRFGFFGLISGVFWLVARGYYLDLQKAKIVYGCMSWSWGWELNPYRAALQATA